MSVLLPFFIMYLTCIFTALLCLQSSGLESSPCPYRLPISFVSSYVVHILALHASSGPSGPCGDRWDGMLGILHWLPAILSPSSHSRAAAARCRTGMQLCRCVTQPHSVMKSTAGLPKPCFQLETTWKLPSTGPRWVAPYE